MISPQPRVYRLKRDMEGIWLLGYWLLHLLALVALAVLAVLAYQVTGDALSMMAEYRKGVIVKELESLYGTSWMASSMLPSAELPDSPTGVTHVLLWFLGAMTCWGIFLVWIGGCLAISHIRHHVRLQVVGITLLIVVACLYVSGSELHMAYKVQMLQELDLLEQVREETDMAPFGWERDWQVLTDMQEWKALPSSVQAGLTEQYKNNAGAVAYLQDQVWDRWPHQWIAWAFQIVPIDKALWPESVRQGVEASRDARGALPAWPLGFLLLAGFVLMLKGYETVTRSSRMLDALSDYPANNYLGGLQSMEGVVSAHSYHLSDDEDDAANKAIDRKTLATLFLEPGKGYRSFLSRLLAPALRPQVVDSCMGSAFNVCDDNGVSMSVSLDGAIVVPSSSQTHRVLNSRGRKVHIQTGDHLWVVGYPVMDARDPARASFENSGRQSSEMLGEALSAAIGVPGPLLVTHFRPDDLRRMISSKGYVWLGAALVGGMLTAITLISAVLGITSSTLLWAIPGAVITGLIVKGTHSILLINTRRRLRSMAQEQLRDYLQHRAAVVAALRDIQKVGGGLGRAQEDVVSAVLAQTKDGMDRPYAAMANMGGVVRAVSSLHQDLAAYQDTSSDWARAMQVLSQDVHQLRQHQRGLVRSDALLDEFCGNAPWYYVRNWIIRRQG